MRHLDYKGYSGTIEYSSQDGLLFGKVQGIRSLISYEGASGKELDEDFRSAIDEYLADCKEEAIKPEKAFKGSFNVRVSSDLHKQAALYALREKMSLNSFVAESIKYRLEQPTSKGRFVSTGSRKVVTGKSSSPKKVGRIVRK